MNQRTIGITNTQENVMQNDLAVEREAMRHGALQQRAFAHSIRRWIESTTTLLVLLLVAPPVHAAYWEEFPPTTGWTEINQMIHPENTPSPQGSQAPQAYFYALQFGFQDDGGCGGYTGLQADTANRPAPQKAIFSIWCALGAQSTGIAGPFAGEGNGYQTLIPYDWVGGHEYTFSVRRSSPTAPEWSSYVTDATAGTAETWIGTIQVPSTWGGLRGYTSNFVEWYGPRPASCLDQPYAAVHFGQPTASGNGLIHPIPLDTNTLNTNYGTGACSIPPNPGEAQEGQGLYFETGTNPMCGNGVREGVESCDGDDSTACPGRCQLDCTCLAPCGPTPDPSCRQPFVPRKASLTIKNHVDDGKDRLQWSWRSGSATTKPELGDPVASDTYALCVYDAGALRSTTRIEPGGLCAGRPCWTQSTRGFRYKSKVLLPDGAARLKLVAGMDGKAQIQLAGKGSHLATPVLTTLQGPVIVQLVRSGGGPCWTATYSTPFLKNDGMSFVAKAD